MPYIGTQPKDVRSFGRAKFDFTATQGQTAFTGADDDSKTLGFTDGQIEVYVNGILMDESDFTTSNGNTVTLASAANLNDIISIVALQTDIPNSDYVPASGGNFTGAVTASNGLTVDDAGATPLTVDRATNNGTMIEMQKDGSSVGTVGIESSGFVVDGEASHAGMKMFATSIGPRRNSADVDNTIDLGWTGGRFKDLYLGGGAYIGGTGAANYLDDYEEGTFTPSIAGTTNTPGFWNNSGKYTKIGNMVMIQYFTQLSHSPAPTFSNNSAALAINGLPFTVVGSGYSGSQGVMNAQAFQWNGGVNTQSVSGQISASAENNTTAIKFQVSGSGATRGEVNNQSLVNSAAIIEVTLFYRVA